LTCDETLYQSLGLKGHNGLDIPLKSGEEILASHDGVVVYLSNDPMVGLGIKIWNEVDNYKTIYWHNKLNLVNKGQNVKAGEVIAYGDNTGLSSGDHLHYGLKLTDDKGNTINRDNGFNGAIDPIPHLVWFEDDMKLTREQVVKHYLLARKAFTEAEVVHWTGRELDELQDKMLEDDYKKLKENLNL